MQKDGAKALQHRDQPLASPARSLSAILHTIGLYNSFIAFSLLVTRPSPFNDAWGWQFQFLTIIALALTTVTFAFGLVADIFLSRALFSIKNTLALACAPLDVLVTLLYWGLRAIDAKLVIPPDAPPLTTIQDLLFHGVPALMLGLDVLLFSPPSTLSKSRALVQSGVVATLYWSWVEMCKSHNGYYPYPLFDDAGLNGRIGLFVASAIVMTLSSIGLRALYSIVNGSDSTHEKLQ